MKKWNALSLDNKLIYKLADDLNVSIEISKLLIKRGITDYAVSYTHLTLPTNREV